MSCARTSSLSVDGPRVATILVRLGNVMMLFSPRVTGSARVPSESRLATPLLEQRRQRNNKHIGLRPDAERRHGCAGHDRGTTHPDARNRRDGISVSAV